MSKLAGRRLFCVPGWSFFPLQQIHSDNSDRQYDLPLCLLKTTKGYLLFYNWLSCLKKPSLFPLSHPEPGSQMLQMKLPLLSWSAIC